MKLNKKQFLGIDLKKSSFQDATVIIIPFPYEGGISYGKGTAKGPDAIIDASCHLELYDDVLGIEPYNIGICTVEPPHIPLDPKIMTQVVYDTTKEALNKDKFIISIGGDHSISPGYCKALKEKHNELSVIQIDAHADLRKSYEGDQLSHACTMSRIREITTRTLQIGIRSMSRQEVEYIKDEHIEICTMNDYRNGNFALDSSLEKLSDSVFITFDVDVLDWSVIRSTGTPEPGGLLWDEVIILLQRIFSLKKVVGFDMVELVGDNDDRNSAFAAAKLIYKMIGFKFFMKESSLKKI